MDIKPDPRTPCLEYIYVTVRMRPLSNNEEESGDEIAWDCEDNYILRNRNQGTDAYMFARAFGQTCSIQKVYDEGAKSIALSTLVGVNAIIFAYGQTSSGKTFTMKGITKNAVKDIFEHINLNLGRDFVVKFSALEISNEDVVDLLSRESGPLGLLEVLEKGNIVEEVVKDIDHVTRLIGNCEVEGQVGEPATSDTSSSSHRIIRLTVESRPRENLGHSKPFIASLYLVDLAGSEPASHIDARLRTLRTVIQKLRLQSFRTAMICTISPALSQVEQSRSTLSFATWAKEFISVPRLNKYETPHTEDYAYVPPDICSIIYRLFHGSNSVYSQSTCINWRYPKFERLHIGSGLPPLKSEWEQKSPLLFYFSSGTKWRFLHPLTGDIYETHFPFLANATFRCSEFGWVLMSRDPGSLFFFNPFINTTRTIDLPGFKHTLIFESSTFTAPPTSPTCKVIILGTASKGTPSNILTRLIVCTCSRGESDWNQQIITAGLELPFQVAECNPIFYAEGIYFQLGARGDLAIFQSGQDGRILLDVLQNPEAPEVAFNKRLYIGKHKRKVLMVSVGRLDGTPLRVFELIWSPTRKWEPVDTIGKMTMFLSKDGSVLVSAKADDIDDRLYFMKIRKRYGTTYIFDEIVFYSLKNENYYYHCFNKDYPCVDLSEVEEAGFSRSTWIEPNNSERLDQDGMFDWSILPAEEEEEDEDEHEDIDEDEDDEVDEDEEEDEEDEDEDEDDEEDEDEDEEDEEDEEEDKDEDEDEEEEDEDEDEDEDA